jgi:hypothetical protein
MSKVNDSGNSPTRRWIAIAGWVVLAVAVIFQWRAITQLRSDIEWLRVQPQASPPDASSQPAASAAGEAVAMEQLQKERLEVLELVKELRQLRERASSPPADLGAVASRPVPSSGPAVQGGGDESRQLVLAAMGGDSSALDRLADLAAAVRTMNTNEQALLTRSALWSAFDLLGTEAGKGNTGALQAIWQASRISNLQGLAVKALGQAAGMGNEEALRPLLDPDTYLILRSSATAALKPAADAGNERAIQALAATAADPKHQGLRLMVVQGLETAAAAGNATAIDGLATIATATNQMIRKAAVRALEAAARKNQPRAEEALRNLGWR